MKPIPEHNRLSALIDQARQQPAPSSLTGQPEPILVQHLREQLAAAQQEVADLRAAKARRIALDEATRHSGHAIADHGEPVPFLNLRSTRRIHFIGQRKPTFLQHLKALVLLRF